MNMNENIFLAKAGDCTVELQSALSEAAEAGRVLRLAPGVHQTGGLALPSGVHLHIPEGAVLRFSAAYQDYERNRVDVIAEDSDRAMLLAKNASGIRISGEGVIEAPGCDYIVGRLEDMGTHVPAPERPRVLVLDHCQDVQLTGFSVRQSPMWTIHLIACQDVEVSNLDIENDREMPNTDGLVIDSCERVAIRNCQIATADDGIVLKTSKGADGKPVGACRDVLVEHCQIESRSCALKIGTETHGDVENISFVDCDIVRSNRALGIFSRDGGRIRNIVHRDIRVEASETPDGFWGSGEAITINVVDRRRERPAGPVEAVRFERITGTMEGAINLVADGASGIAGVVFKDVCVRQRDGRFKGHRYDMRPTRFDLAPSPDAAGRANAWVKDESGQVIGLVAYPGGMPSLFASNVEGLELSEVLFDRPSPLPQGWSEEAIVTVSGASPVWS
ncbi:glycoside hydrolase family 28 protein [Rhizobium helianthi]|uniref:Glycoside hydrolase family 28 protein n=1 Tax=Rhizobium helianthi TaxID=1132695 RepID=A0ABW4M844_9HYPH